MCSVGGEVLRVDAWGVDVALTGSQKALGAPPGLSIVVASQAAMKAGLSFCCAYAWVVAVVV